MAEMPADRPIVFSATNPCHVWDQVRGLHSLGVPVRFVSGYPRDRLPGCPDDLDVVTASLPSLFTYAVTRVTGRSNPLARRLYRWQDILFDRAASRHVSSGDRMWIAVPGQAMRTFQRARELNLRPVLNHASGPDEIQSARLSDLLEHYQIPAKAHAPIHDTIRIQIERGLAERHLVGAEIVARQMGSLGIPQKHVGVAPYGVDPQVFYPPSTPPATPQRPFTVVFAGQLHPRKGLFWLLETWRAQAPPEWQLKIFGAGDASFRRYLIHHSLPSGVSLEGQMSQAALADQFRAADCLVLPSIEEAFGLVVPQALQCGTPCVVSAEVGAADLITDTSHGHIVPYGDQAALAAALNDLAQRRPRVHASFSYAEAAETLNAVLQAW